MGRSHFYLYCRAVASTRLIIIAVPHARYRFRRSSKILIVRPPAIKSAGAEDACTPAP
jgi:hypothetical protein